MRTVEELPEDDEGTRHLDYDENATEVLAVVDSQLEKYGLEVVLKDEDSSWVEWTISLRKEKANAESRKDPTPDAEGFDPGLAAR